MSPLFAEPTVDLYPKKSHFKWVVLGVSICISVGSIWYTDQLVSSIRDRERKQIDLYAETLEYLINENDASNPNLIFIYEQIIEANNTIPVILTNEFGLPELYRNIPQADRIRDDSARNQYLLRRVEQMRGERPPIRVTLVDDYRQVYGHKHIYYTNSLLLVQLRYYPYVQLSVIAIFGLITFAVFNYSRRAEQNRVWVGLAKETAHQLGTPLSALMAWVEYFREAYPDQADIFNELQKDVDRLHMITERFSSIGSVPQMKEEPVVQVIREVISYLQPRVSTKVAMTCESTPDDEILAYLNKPLFAWVIENIIKNAVDAMEGKGNIHIEVVKLDEGKVAIDISDTGKGIAKARIKQVFNPGYTTKRRGWGLGLTLAKRIVENYHGGKIFVKSSELNVGTTFRILLKT